MSSTSPVAAVKAATTLAILTGPHAPAQVALADGVNTVGTGLENDVVLAGDGLEPLHFTLTIVDGAVRLDPVGGAVRLGSTLVERGQSALCPASATLQAGGTTFELRTSRPIPPARRRSNAAGNARYAVAVACAATILSFFAFPAAVPRTVPMLTIAPAPGPARAALSATALPVNARDSLEQQLGSIGLGSITLASLADGSIEARGEIMPHQLDQWHEAQHWFDAGFGGQAVLINHVTATAAPPLAIQAVWPGPHPYVVDGAGEKLFPGAALRGGWVVDAITADHVLIRRRSQTLAVRF